MADSLTAERAAAKLAAADMTLDELRLALAPAKKWVAPLRSQAWFKAIHGKLAREIAYPPLTADLRASMRDRFTSDVEQLGALLGRDLTSWLSEGNTSNSGSARAA